MKERDITLKAKGLFSLVMSLPDDWDFSINGICAIIKENYTAVNSAINELIEAGYCRRERVKENGKFVGCNYEFSEVKMGSPRLGFLNVENPRVENPRVENLNDNNNSSIDTPIIDKEINKESLSNDKQKKDEELFDEFWKLYPVKKGKKVAEKSWKRLSLKDRKEAISKLPAYIADCVECKRNYKHPATYLNQSTWEDEFADAEEQPAVAEIPEDDIEPWNKFQEWMIKNTPHICREKITYQDFAAMRGMVMFKSKLMADILLAIDMLKLKSDYLQQFETLAESPEFSKRRFSNE